MSAPLSHELFYEAHRGLKLHSGNNFTINKNELGMHWSADEQVAKDFGGTNYMPEATRVLHARIPVSSVETDTGRLTERNVHLNTKSDESEVPVKQGAPILVTGMSKYKEHYGQPRTGGRLATKARRRTYNPPREMKA